MTTADNFKARRIAAGMSQSQLAKAAGVSVRTLQGYEQGARDLKKASWRTLSAIAEALECNIDDILTAKNETEDE